MDMTLADLCKQLRVNGVYAYVQEYQSDNPDLNQFLTSALQAEIDKRHLNRQMRLLRQAGFRRRNGLKTWCTITFRRMEERLFLH
jgi:hypothetical protein